MCSRSASCAFVVMSEIGRKKIEIAEVAAGA
jgi:hypothetical protein